MRLLWSLPKAVPAILRHAVAYAELAGHDLDQTQRELGARLYASAILGLAVVFVIFSCCLIVVALTWDTPYRVTAVVCMAGVFALVALIAGLYRAKVIGAQTPFLGNVRREWAEDRALLERILSERD